MVKKPCKVANVLAVNSRQLIVLKAVGFISQNRADFKVGGVFHLGLYFSLVKCYYLVLQYIPGCKHAQSQTHLWLGNEKQVVTKLFRKHINFLEVVLLVFPNAAAIADVQIAIGWQILAVAFLFSKTVLARTATKFIVAGIAAAAAAKLSAIIIILNTLAVVFGAQSRVITKKGT